MSQEASRGALQDVRVVEMGSILAGPFCGQLLGDMGAEVIKVEAPGQGDPMRIWGREKAGGKSLWWQVVARNKKSVTVNCREREGQEIIRRLVECSDILLENFRPGTMERWGLGYQELVKVNPALIMVRVSGYGQTGPYSARAGYGSIGEAMGGLRYVVGDPDAPPSRVGISIGDSLAALFATIGTLSALHHRDRTGQGQVVDAAIYESVLGVMESLVPEYQAAGHVRERSGSILPGVAPSNVYPTRDGAMMLIAANQDTVFRRLAEAMNRPDLAEDPRYRTHDARGENQRQLDEIIAAWSSGLDAEELAELMERSGVPSGKIYRADDMLDDPHFKARETIARVLHPEYGELAMQNVFPRLSLTPGEIRSVGPRLGEHNDEVLGGILGLDEQERQGLASRGVI